MPEPRQPTMIGGRRPIRSERLPTNGIRITATALPTTEIHRYVVVLIPMPYAALVAYVAPNTVDRGRDGVHQRHADHAEHVRAVLADGLHDRRLGHLAVLASSWNAGVSSTRRRMM